LTFIVDSCECWKATVTLSKVLYTGATFHKYIDKKGGFV